MFLKAARIVTTLVVLLMSLEIVGAAVTAFPTESSPSLAFHAKKMKGSSIVSLFLEKAEEENEKTEEEKEGMPGVLIADFSTIAISLCLFHTSRPHATPLAFQYDVRPPVHQLNCVFII